MLEGQPSRTAMGAAAHRATHQLIEEGRIFADPLAIPILGADPAALVRQAEERPLARGLRFFIAARSELAEAKLREAVENGGVSQLVLLGAGLDTFGYRNPFSDRLTVFEVDHPATQTWKVERLVAAGIAVPRTVRFVPVDFESTYFLDALLAAGFEPEQRSFFTWLGTVPYLTKPAVRATLDAIGGLAGGAALVFDYAEPAEEHSAEGAELIRDLADRVAAAGEPLTSWYEPDSLHTELRAAGFRRIEDFNVRALAERHFGTEVVEARARAGKPFSERGGHVLFASSWNTDGTDRGS